MGFVIFDQVNQVNSETQPIHLIFTDLLMSIVFGIGLGIMSFEVDTNRPSHTGLGRFFDPYLKSLQDQLSFSVFSISL